MFGICNHLEQSLNSVIKEITFLVIFVMSNTAIFEKLRLFFKNYWGKVIITKIDRINLSLKKFIFPSNKTLPYIYLEKSWHPVVNCTYSSQLTHTLVATMCLKQLENFLIFILTWISFLKSQEFVILFQYKHMDNVLLIRSKICSMTGSTVVLEKEPVFKWTRVQILVLLFFCL